jgi:hypothetical protein
MLTTHDLLDLTRTLPNFLGVFSLNTLPDLRESGQHTMKYKTLIANLDVESLPGSHWVGIFAKDSKIEVFDSLGMDPPPLLQAWAARNSTSWIYKKLVVQHPLSVTCGYYALIFCIARPDFDIYDNSYDATVAYISSLEI